VTLAEIRRQQVDSAQSMAVSMEMLAAKWGTPIQRKWWRRLTREEQTAERMRCTVLGLTHQTMFAAEAVVAFGAEDHEMIEEMIGLCKQTTMAAQILENQARRAGVVR